MIQFKREGVNLLGGAGISWASLGLGVVALLVASPKMRRGARSLLVSTMAGGMKMAKGLSDFGAEVKAEFQQAANEARQATPPNPEPPSPEPPAIDPMPTT